ncbi:MAG: ATP-binding cassette domain-containing protein [Lachnospiraceae bacterium]|nr:ATP-binding cassette domain-containing protein [Lachnospiraceae bacterium]
MLEVKHLTYEVMENGVKRKLVDNVSFAVQDGEMLVITGPNGGGKSTIAKLLMGIEKADRGEIRLNGQDLSSMNVNERANAGMGYAFQQPPAFKGMTVERLLNLAAGRTLPESVCCELLSSVGMCAREYLKREADATLSGGERKRIEIATVLAKVHKICIFDEPEAGIDLWSFSMLVDQFERIHEKKKESLLLISHQERIIRMADRILVVSDGRIQEGGSREEMLPRLFPEERGCACGNESTGREEGSCECEALRGGR